MGEKKQSLHDKLKFISSFPQSSHLIIDPALQLNTSATPSRSLHVILENPIRKNNKSESPTATDSESDTSYSETFPNFNDWKSLELEKFTQENTPIGKTNKSDLIKYKLKMPRNMSLQDMAVLVKPKTKVHKLRKISTMPAFQTLSNEDEALAIMEPTKETLFKNRILEEFPNRNFDKRTGLVKDVNIKPVISKYIKSEFANNVKKPTSSDSIFNSLTLFSSAGYNSRKQMSDQMNQPIEMVPASVVNDQYKNDMKFNVDNVNLMKQTKLPIGSRVISEKPKVIEKLFQPPKKNESMQQFMKRRMKSQGNWDTFGPQVTN